MIEFKIVFPAGYNIINEYNDNIDINILFSNDQVYFATIFTIENIKHLMDKHKSNYFWADSMLIINKINHNSLKESIYNALQEKTFELIFSKIGNIKSVYRKDIFFNDIKDFSNGFEI
jgi:hypothetical protein